MGEGNKVAVREPESDFIEDTKIVCVSRCYFKTRPFGLKIKMCTVEAVKCAPVLWLLYVQHPATSQGLMLSRVEGWISCFLSHIWPLRLNWLWLTVSHYQASCTSVSLSPDSFCARLPFFFFSSCWLFPFQVLFDFASLCLSLSPLSPRQCLAFSSKFISLFPPHTHIHTHTSPSMGQSPCITPLLPLAWLRKGSNSATFPLVKLGGAIKQPGGLVGSQMVAAELSFC